MKNILILGANGMVGQDLIRLLKKYNTDANIKLCNRNNFLDNLNIISSFDVIFNCASSDVSEIIYPLVQKNQIYIDNSSYLRMNNKVPLVVPEINMTQSNIFANPNCVTIILTLFLNSIKRFNPKNIKVSTYQSISGAGKNKFTDFINDHKIVSEIDLSVPQAKIDDNALAFNFYPHESEKDDLGFSGEENKVMLETKKIINMDVFPTCIRIPAIRCHGESITCELEETTKEELINEISKYNIKYVENPEAIDVELNESIIVGHIRRNPFNNNEWNFYIIGDQLTRGAAYNAFKIYNILNIINENRECI